MAIPFEQAHAEHSLKVGDHPRYHRLGNGELLRRFRHAFALRDGEQDVEVAQPNAAANAFRPVHWGTHIVD